MRASFLAGLILAPLLVPAVARADEGTVEAAPAPTPPPASTTVVAPPGSDLKVSVPTAGGGTVTASGCTAVTVQGGDAVVKGDGTVVDTVCAPYAPPDPTPRIVFVDARPRFAPDSTRGALITLGAVSQAIGSIAFGRWYLNTMQTEAGDCLRSGGVYSGYTAQAQRDQCGSAGAWGPLAFYTAAAAFAPTAASFYVGATRRAWVLSSAIAASIAVGKVLDFRDRDGGGWDGVGLGGAIFGFVLPTTLGIVALATTPHAEDLAAEKGKDGKASLQQLAVAPVGDRRNGLTGATVGLQGAF